MLYLHLAWNSAIAGISHYKTCVIGIHTPLNRCHRYADNGHCEEKLTPSPHVIVCRKLMTDANRP